MPLSTALRINEDLELRAAHPKYAESLFQLVDQNRNHLRKWLDWVDNTLEVSDSRAFLRAAHQYNIGGQKLTTLIFYQGKMCGAISYNQIDKKHKQSSIGYWLAKSYTGRGIMTLACHRLVRYGFEQLQLNRITIQMSVKNLASKGIPERLGFQLEGIARQALCIQGTYHDLYTYSLLRSDEWNKELSATHPPLSKT